MVEYAATAPSPRIMHSGEHLDHVHLIDLNLYDTSLFANACLLDLGADRLLFDAGTSNTTGQIINYLRFYELEGGKYYIIPSHHHFDHSGGIPSLLDHFKKNHVPVQVCTTSLMAEYLVDLPNRVSGARRQFQQMMGDISSIPQEDMLVLGTGEKLVLDDGSCIELIPTPGHSPDHVSPVVWDGTHAKLCFLGEALGINLKNRLSPIPSSTAPCYDSRDYKSSVARIKALLPDVGIFSHVGGVIGSINVSAVCDLALEKLEEVTTFITELYAGGIASTSEMVARVKETYRDYIATCVMDDTIVSNLTFLLVYGVLKDLNLK
jgi:glyoxylase-like metal-dependent hydrolase (beta-lactamase superfamily II)